MRRSFRYSVVSRLSPGEVRFLADYVRSDLQLGDRHFDHLDELYSKFFYYQTALARLQHQYGELTEEERNMEWVAIDQQIAEWDERRSEWRELRWYLNRLLEKLRVLGREAHRVAA